MGDERRINYTIPKTSQQIPLELIDFPGQEEYSTMKDQYYLQCNTSDFQFLTNPQRMPLLLCLIGISLQVLMELHLLLTQYTV